MTQNISRRRFFKTTGALGAGIVLSGAAGLRLGAAELAQGAPNAEKLGWCLGIQAWTFNKFTWW
jgi:hypothetical protein